MSKKPARTHLSDAEWKVMQVVWRRAPVTARDVREALLAETGWAHTTVKTLLTRLCAKGALGETRVGNASSYTPAVAEDAARRSALRAFAERAFGGDLVPMVRFMIEERELSPRDRARLRRALDDDAPEPRP